MRFGAQTAWTGSTAQGWDRYDRAHSARAEPAKQELTLTTAEELGDPDHLNPEQLLLMAASSCQLLWFLHLAAKARIDVVRYEDRCEAEMPEGRITRVVLRPEIEVAGDVAEDRVLKLCEQAHRNCNIAKSLGCPVELEPRLVQAPSPTTPIECHETHLYGAFHGSREPLPLHPGPHREQRQTEEERPGDA